MQNPFGQQDVEIQEERVVYDGFFKVKQFTVRHKLFEGRRSPPVLRELFSRGPAVAVLLYDLKLDCVVLVEQFRIGVLGTENPWLLEVIAGMVEPGETPPDVAKREAFEESGAKIENLIHISDYYTSPGGSDERISLYCACINSKGLGGIHGLKEEAEDIRVQMLDRQAAYDGISNGKIANAATIIALQWLQLNVSKLQDLHD